MEKHFFFLFLIYFLHKRKEKQNTIQSVLNTSPSHEMQSFFSPNWLNYRLPLSCTIGFNQMLVPNCITSLSHYFNDITLLFLHPFPFRYKFFCGLILDLLFFVGKEESRALRQFHLQALLNKVTKDAQRVWSQQCMLLPLPSHATLIFFLHLQFYTHLKLYSL